MTDDPNTLGHYAQLAERIGAREVISFLLKIIDQLERELKAATERRRKE